MKACPNLEKIFTAGIEPKSDNQKLKLLYIIKLLERKTDEKNGVCIGDIIEYLEKCDIKAERKSLYNDIKMFRKLGYDIMGGGRLARSIGIALYLGTSRILS